MIRYINKNIFEKKNLRFLRVKFVNKTINSFCRVFPINTASDAFGFLVLSKGFYLCLWIRSTLFHKSKWAVYGKKHYALESTIGKLCLIRLSPFPLGIGTNKNGWDNKHPSRLYFGYPYNHRRLLK